MIDPHKSDMLAAVLEEFDLHTVAYIGQDDDFASALAERVGERKVEGPGDDPADVVFLDEWSEDREENVRRISTCFSKVKGEGFLLGSEYLHSNIPVMRAVADSFNLMCVQIGPAGVWAVRR